MLHEVRELDSSNTAIAEKTEDYFFAWESFVYPRTILPCSSLATTADDFCVVGSDVVSGEYVSSSMSIGSSFFSYAQLEIEIFVVEKDVTLQYLGTNINLHANDASVNLEISDYDFCGTNSYHTCFGNKQGSAVEVEFIVEGINNKVMSASSDGSVVSARDGSGAGSIYPSSKFVVDDNAAQRSVQVTTSQPFANSFLTYRFNGPFTTINHKSTVRLATSAAPTTVISMLLVIVMVLLL
jgi:hypothetical protein